MIKKINRFDVFLVFVIAMMFSLLAFANNRNNARYIENIEVKLLSIDNHFITQERVEKIITANLPQNANISLSELDLKMLEEKLNTHPMIAHSEVFTSIDGTLYVEVSQKKAIARVMNSNGSYYLDDKANKMPLSNQFSAHVPIVHGSINKKNKEVFAHLLRTINNDKFLKTAITGIKINGDQSVIFTVRNYDYKIEFGHLKDIEKKFDNYKAFVHYAQNDTLIDHYKNVNLRFTKQVVCTK